MRIGTCMACQIGDHKNCAGVMQAVPEGMMGGVVCGCEGECEGEKEKRRASFLRRLGIRRRRGDL